MARATCGLGEKYVPQVVPTNPAAASDKINDDIDTVRRLPCPPPPLPSPAARRRRRAEGDGAQLQQHIDSLHKRLVDSNVPVPPLNALPGMLGGLFDPSDFAGESRAGRGRRDDTRRASRQRSTSRSRPGPVARR